MGICDRFLKKLTQQNEKICLVCGNPPQSTHYVDWAGNCVCEAHRDIVHFCISCSRYCKPRDKYNFGNRFSLCPICESDLINQKIVGNVVAYIKKAYIKAGFGEIRNWHLYVTDPETMYQKMQNPYIKGFANRIGSKYEIYVLKHLSRVSFADVLSHEILHIWQYNNKYSPEKWKCEGFCNLGSYYVLSHIATEEALERIAAMERNPDLVYGEGFRRMKAVYDQGGWAAAKQLLIS